MPKKPLRSQLNQVRAWVRQGRTDAWIAHQLDVSASELREFRRRHELSADEEAPDDLDLRDEIEAEIEAAAREEALAADEDEAEDDEVEDGLPQGSEDAGDENGRAVEPPTTEDQPDGGEGREGARRRRGGRRRGGRRRGGSKRPGAALEASFDHGGEEGFGLWLDPVVQDDPVYAEHWKGHRRVEVTVEPERIVIKRS